MGRGRSHPRCLEGPPAAQLPQLCRRKLGAKRSRRDHPTRWQFLEEDPVMILAGDIGGTHTRIALFNEEVGKLKLVLEHVYPSREHKSLDEIISLFISNENVKVKVACFGIAGPVLHGRVSTPNLAWVVDAIQLTKLLGIESVWVINDLQAHASGVDDLETADFVRSEEHTSELQSRQ